MNVAEVDGYLTACSGLGLVSTVSSSNALQLRVNASLQNNRQVVNEPGRSFESLPINNIIIPLHDYPCWMCIT